MSQSEDLPFGSAYSSTYDVLYSDKDYDAEVAVVRSALGLQRGALLDLGCGTASHAVRLARAGFDVVGVDRSASMLAIAREKARGTNIEFVCGDIVDFFVDRRFDGALMMFAVLGYLVESEGIAAALANVRRHLRPGARFAFDVWFGPAVLRERPTARARTLQIDGRTVERDVRSVLDLMSQVVDVSYRLRSDGVDDVVELHRMRFFFPRELELLLTRAGFSAPTITSFPDGGPPSESTWNVLAVATAV